MIHGFVILLQQPKPDLTTNLEEDDKSDKDYKPHGIAAKTAAGGYTRKNKKERAQKSVSARGIKVGWISQRLNCSLD